MDNLSKMLLIFFLGMGVILNAQGDYDEDLPPSERDDEFVGFSKRKNKEKTNIEKDLSRIRVGGDFGLAFTNFAFFAEVSPLAGYMLVEDRLEVGGGIIFQHNNIRRAFISPNGFIYQPAVINIYGGRVYARIYIWDGIHAQIEPMLINYRERKKNVAPPNDFVTLTIGNVLAGGGYTFGHPDGKFLTNMALMTNLIINPLYPRRTLIPRIGFQITL